MSTHVPQQPLLLFLALPTRQTFLDTQPAEPQQDLIENSETEERKCEGVKYV